MILLLWKKQESRCPSGQFDWLLVPARIKLPRHLFLHCAPLAPLSSVPLRKFLFHTIFYLFYHCTQCYWSCLQSIAMRPSLCLPASLVVLLFKPCLVSSTSASSFLPHKGQTIADEIKCYSLPYSSISFVSHLITYYTIFALSRAEVRSHGRRTSIGSWTSLSVRSVWSPQPL